MSDQQQSPSSTRPDSNSGSGADNGIEKKPNLLQVIQSILAGLFGVQSAKNRERDFTKGDASNFIAVYVILVAVFVIAMIIIVNVVLGAAAK